MLDFFIISGISKEFLLRRICIVYMKDMISSFKTMFSLQRNLSPSWTFLCVSTVKHLRTSHLVIKKIQNAIFRFTRKASTTEIASSYIFLEEALDDDFSLFILWSIVWFLPTGPICFLFNFLFINRLRSSSPCCLLLFRREVGDTEMGSVRPSYFVSGW